MSDAPVGQHPYTDPPPIEQRRFHEDPVPPGDANFLQIMQGRGAPAPRPGYEHEQQSVGRPPDTIADVTVSPQMTVAELMLLPPEQQQQALDDLRARAAAFAAQREQLAEELAQEPSAAPEEAP